MPRDDMRTSTGVTKHRKIRRLIKALGHEAFTCLVTLWGYVAEERKDGRLTGMSVQDIEDEAGWEGETGTFVTTLAALKLLDRQGPLYMMHNWSTRQPYVATHVERSAQAKEAARVRWGKKLSKPDADRNAPGMRAASEEHADRNADSENSNAPYPYPYPYPYPDPVPSPDPNPPPDPSPEPDPSPTPDPEPSPDPAPGSYPQSAENSSTPPGPSAPPAQEQPESGAPHKSLREGKAENSGDPPNRGTFTSGLKAILDSAKKPGTRRRKNSIGLTPLDPALANTLAPAAEEKRIAELREQGEAMKAKAARSSAPEDDSFTPPPAEEGS